MARVSTSRGRLQRMDLFDLFKAYETLTGFDLDLSQYINFGLNEETAVTDSGNMTRL